MVDLFGRRWTRNALLEHVGDISQVGGVRLVTFVEGPERDVLAGEVRTGSGLMCVEAVGSGHLRCTLADLYRGTALQPRGTR